MNRGRNKNEHFSMNRFKLIVLPLVIFFFAIVGMGGITFYASKHFLLTQMKTEGLNLTKQVIRHIHDNQQSLNTINEMLETKIRIAANTLINHEGPISNELLYEMLTQLDVDELHWMDQTGRIRYSTIEGYLNWIPFEGHPLYDFIRSQERIIMEDIRPDAEFGNYIKYGAVKRPDGSFVQVGIRADKIKNLTEQFSHGTLVKELEREENVVYALFIGSDLEILGYGEMKNPQLINTAFDHLRGLSEGDLWVYEHHEPTLDLRILDMAVPVFQDKEKIGYINIGLSMKSAYDLIYYHSIITLLMAAIMFILFYWIQNKNIIRPVKELDQYIEQIDVEKNLNYKLPALKNDTFSGLILRINKILDRTYSYFYALRENEEELSASNEEIRAACEQLTASEEELRTQYDEIQEYVEKLENLKQKYEIAIKGTSSAVWEVSLKDRGIYFSQEFESIVGYQFPDKKEVFEVLNQLLPKEGKATLLKEYNRFKRGQADELSIQLQIIVKGEALKWVMIRGKGIYDARGNLTHINGILLDINKMKLQEEYIQHLAYHDPLTNLPNRRKFLNKLRQELERGTQGAVMLLDLDNFKEINDSLGHVYGDLVLKEIAALFNKITDPHLFISRFGGDEFLILVTATVDYHGIESYIKKIRRLFNEQKPFSIKNNDIHINFSLGISRFPNDSLDPNQLISNADTALYCVKNSGKNNHRFFSQEMLVNINKKKEIEGILMEALKKEALDLHYQPQVQVTTGEIIGFEALLRLQKHQLPPDQFISIAEETGIIMELGRWVTKAAINQLAQWKEKGLELKPIAINFSTKQLNDEGYLFFLKETLEENQVDPKYLEIEITESILLERTQATMEFLSRLKAIGISIALDDFGTGYSSLSYLTYIPVDKIKLDKSLSDKFLERENLKVIDSLIILAHSLNLKVTAEGVERPEQYRRLKSRNCNYIQGYLFSKPLQAQEVEKIYNDNLLNRLYSEEV